MTKEEWVKVVVGGLKDYCTVWGHDWVENLKKDSSVKNFRKLFFKVTHLYYVLHQNNCYNVTFSKKEDVAFVKRCGKDYDERGIDAQIDIEEVIKMLVR